MMAEGVLLSPLFPASCTHIIVSLFGHDVILVMPCNEVDCYDVTPYKNLLPHPAASNLRDLSGQNTQKAYK